MSVTHEPGRLKTPISYYGGKQLMLPHILPLIPEHSIYVEPFFGGGAVFWSKEPVKCEVINDANGNIVNFYEVLKHQYFDLRKKVEATLHSRDTYKKALIIYQLSYLFNDFPVVRAWAFYVVTNQGFATKIGTWGYDRSKAAYRVQNKIDRFQEELSERLKYTQIEQNDACKVISSRDSSDAFIYADPPYVGSDQGHYGGYTEEHFQKLIDTLAALQGKFILSSYPSAQLQEAIAKQGWFTKKVIKNLTASNGRTNATRKKKVEVLTANFKIG